LNHTANAIVTSIETLEALYFLLKSFGAHQARLEMIRTEFPRLTAADQKKTLDELRIEIQSIRDQSGAFATDHKYRELLTEARKQAGRAYLFKLLIDSKLFRQYDRVFPRWSDVKPHALVVFDGNTMEDLRSILEVEGLLFDDAKVLLDRAREAHRGIDDFRKRSPEDQQMLQSHLRTAATAIFHFLEAYVNGVAYDCFHAHHDRLSLEDHDLLGEWNSADKRVRYVQLRKKLFSYPVIAAKMEGVQVDLSDCRFAHDLAGYGKSVRDALTHPSYYVDPQTGSQEKLLIVTGINLALVEMIFASAQSYVLYVESSMGRDPNNTTPWLSN